VDEISGQSINFSFLVVFDVKMFVLCLIFQKSLSVLSVVF
jgi:hypothetical protein